MKKWIEIPQIPLMEQTPREKALLNVIDRQQGMIDDLIKDIEVLKEEVKRLKGHKNKPHIKPSKMDKGNRKGKSDSEKRAGSEKRNRVSYCAPSCGDVFNGGYGIRLRRGRIQRERNWRILVITEYF